MPTSTIIKPIKVYEAEYLPTFEIERGDEDKRSDNDNTKTRKSKHGRKQPIHPSVLNLLEDDVISQESTLPALLLANEASGPEKNLCFSNGPTQLLRHIPMFRFVSFPLSKIS